jgi:hypothetical protein
VIIFVFNGKRVRYWTCMNNGKPIIGAKCRAASFYGAVADQALRQVATLFPDRKVGKLSERKRFSRRDYT